MSKVNLVDKEFLNINPHSAYVMGVLCGDGYVSFSKLRKGRVIIGLKCNDIEFIRKFIREINYWIKYSIKIRKQKEENYDINGKKGKRKPRFVAEFGTSDTNFFDFIKKYDFKTKTWQVPDEILKSKNIKIVGKFLRGFADSEGSVGNRNLNLASINTKGLNQIKRLLRLVNIYEEFGKITISNIRLYIFGKENLKIFKNKIGFTIKRKTRKLAKQLEGYKKIILVLCQIMSIQKRCLPMDIVLLISPEK